MKFDGFGELGVEVSGDNREVRGFEVGVLEDVGGEVFEDVGGDRKRDRDVGGVGWEDWGVDRNELGVEVKEGRRGVRRVDGWMGVDEVLVVLGIEGGRGEGRENGGS